MRCRHPGGGGGSDLGHTRTRGRGLWAAPKKDIGERNECEQGRKGENGDWIQGQERERQERRGGDRLEERGTPDGNEKIEIPK